MINNIILRVLYFAAGALVGILVPTEQVDAWKGTGFFINNQGYIATADHVIGNGKTFLVYYKDKVYTAKVIARNKLADAAIIKISVSGNMALNLNPNVETGENLAVIGYPLGAHNLHIKTGPARAAGLVTTGVAIHAYTCKGNSGSPMVNNNIEVKGILTQGYGLKECSVDGWGPSISYVIKMANEKNIPYYSFEETATYNFNTIFNILEKSNAVVLIYGNK